MGAGAGAAVSRWAWAEVDLDAVRHNVEVLRQAAGDAEVWAVVKADGYGHGSVEVGRAALEAGAAGLCVALVAEGVVLRRAGISAPILVLSQQPASEVPDALEHELALSVYSAQAVTDIAAAGGRDHPVHLKVDTGMHRVGAPAADAVALADHILGSPAVRLAGVCTHLAVADEPADPYTDRQLDAFDAVLGALAATGHAPPLIHAANSAGTLAHPRARWTMVRAGIAVYGISPGPGVDDLAAALHPALALRARVSWVKRVCPGDGISYGLRHTFDRPTTVATVPLGYADGVPRRLFPTGGQVLIGGRRRTIVGVVTMDQVMVDCADDEVSIGDDVVLIGAQGDEHVTASEWATRLGTIAYEITCAISARIPRTYLGTRP